MCSYFAACCLVLAAQPAAPKTPKEIPARVLAADGDAIRVTRNAAFDPNPGDSAEVFVPAAGLPRGALVATGKVAAVGDTFVQIKIDRATGKVLKDHAVRVFSENPVSRAGVKAAGTPPGLSVLEPLKAGQWMTVRRIIEPKDGAGGITAVRISADGSRIAFATPRGTFTVNPDGSKLVQIGDKPNGGYSGGLVDLTADGNRVAWFDAGGVHIANPDGTGRKDLPKGFGMNALRITAKGDRLFALSSEKGGIYAIPTDGSDIKRLVGVEEVAKLDGSAPNNSNWRPSFDISEDGSRVVFQYLHDAYGFDGTGLKPLTQFGKDGDTTLTMVRVAGDGRKVALYHAGNPFRLSIQDWDGGNKATHQGTHLQYGDWMHMTTDGRVALSSGLRLYAADGKSRQELSNIPGHEFAFPTAGLAAVSADTKRACLRLGTVSQLAVVDVNPAALGPAPPLEDVGVKGVLTTDGTTEVTITARVTTADVQYVGFVPIRNGVGFGSGIVAMTGNAADDLADPKDGKVFTGRFRLDPTAKAAPGPLTFRVAAVNKAGHATVVDVVGVEARTP